MPNHGLAEDGYGLLPEGTYENPRVLEICHELGYFNYYYIE
jgi:hypothetical protein